MAFDLLHVSVGDSGCGRSGVVVGQSGIEGGEAFTVNASCFCVRRQRGLEPSAFNTLIRVSRAFTCFQLTELIRRVPNVLRAFAANVLIVTALPDLFFDEDVRDREARASFEHALEGLQQIAMLPISIAVFSDATSFKTKRRDFFHQLCKQASQVLRVEARSDSELSFSCEKTAPLLSQ